MKQIFVFMKWYWLGCLGGAVGWAFGSFSAQVMGREMESHIWLHAQCGTGLCSSLPLPLASSRNGNGFFALCHLAYKRFQRNVLLSDSGKNPCNRWFLSSLNSYHSFAPPTPVILWEVPQVAPWFSFFVCEKNRFSI